MSNPYLDAARKVNFGRVDWTSAGRVVREAEHLPDTEFRAALSKAAINAVSVREMRDHLRARYAYAIPNDKALKLLVRFAPLVEIGAGVGYWCHLLRERGVDIIAYDQKPPKDTTHRNGYFNYGGTVGTLWTDVRYGTAVKAREHPDRTLFLCWPPYDESMAAKALGYYAGSTVAYVGEGRGGCTGDTRFHNTLEREWEEVDSCRIPQWDGIHDALVIYQRKAARS
jgi:hypothetical protein